MVKDKHTKDLNFMENMKFNDSCLGFAVETKQHGCLVLFLGKDSMSYEKSSLLACHPLYGMTLSFHRVDPK